MTAAQAPEAIQDGDVVAGRTLPAAGQSDHSSRHRTGDRQIGRCIDRCVDVGRDRGGGIARRDSNADQLASDVQADGPSCSCGPSHSNRAGVAIAYSGSGLLSGGTTNPTLTAGVIAAMGDDEYDYVIHPYTDAASLDAFLAEYGDTAGRWSWSRQVYGHGYTALRGTLSALTTAGGLRNDPHHTIAGIDVDCPNPSWEYAAAYGAANAVCINADPGRPTQTTPLNGILCPRAGKRFLLNERQSLLNYGIATSNYGKDGVVRVERAITTYQKNSQGQADTSYLDSETLHQLAEVTRRLRSRITNKYPRHKLANDGTRFGAGQAIVTPSVVKGELIAEYSDMELVGLVENAALFKKYLIVERDTNNPKRINVLFPPDLVDQLRVFAVLNQFRNQYPANA